MTETQDMPTPTQTPALPPLLLTETTELGLAVPPKPATEWREHTAERFEKRHPEAVDAIVTLLKEGNSIAETARIVGPMCGKSEPGQQDGLRKIIQGIVVRQRLDLTEIRKYKAGAVTDEALDKMLEVIPKAGKAELGALSMVATQAHGIKQSAAGEANVVIEHRHTGLPTFEELREAARRKLQEGSAGVVEAEVVLKDEGGRMKDEVGDNQTEATASK